MDLITALARQDLQAMEKLAKVNKIIKLIQFSSVYFPLQTLQFTGKSCYRINMKA